MPAVMRSLVCAYAQSSVNSVKENYFSLSLFNALTAFAFVGSSSRDFI